MKIKEIVEEIVERLEEADINVIKVNKSRVSESHYIYFEAKDGFISSLRISDHEAVGRYSHFNYIIHHNCDGALALIQNAVEAARYAVIDEYPARVECWYGFESKMIITGESKGGKAKKIKLVRS